MTLDPMAALLFDVAVEILATVRMDHATERALHDVTVGKAHVWGEFYGPASSPGLARVLAHRYLDRQGCDEFYLRCALARFGGEQPMPVNNDRAAALSRAMWKRHLDQNRRPHRQGAFLDGRLVFVPLCSDYRCTTCGARMARHADYEEFQHDGCGGLVVLDPVLDSAAPNASATSDSDAK